MLVVLSTRTRIYDTWYTHECHGAGVMGTGRGLFPLRLPPHVTLLTRGHMLALLELMIMPTRCALCTGVVAESRASSSQLQADMAFSLRRGISAHSHNFSEMCCPAVHC